MVAHPFKELSLLHKPEIFKMEELQALLDAAHAVVGAELVRCRAQVACKDLQIARLTRMLRARIRAARKK